MVVEDRIEQNTSMRTIIQHMAAKSDWNTPSHSWGYRRGAYVDVHLRYALRLPLGCSCQRQQGGLPKQRQYRVYTSGKVVHLKCRKIIMRVPTEDMPEHLRQSPIFQARNRTATQLG